MTIDISIDLSGPNALPFVEVTGTPDQVITIDEDLSFEDFNLTGMDTLFTVLGGYGGTVRTFGDTNVLFAVSGYVFSEATIQLYGSGTIAVANAGVIEANISMGSGDGILTNVGLMAGTISMGAGDDVLVNTFFEAVENGVPTIEGDVFMGGGNDIVQNAGVMGNVFLGAGNDVFVTVNAADAGDGLAPGAIASAVFAGEGNDLMRGGLGDDVFNGNQGNDSIFGGNGNDTLSGGKNHDLVQGGSGDDVIMGGQGRDTLSGNNGDDTLFGGQSRDLLFGGKGDDVINAGSGRDTIYGGTGDDTISGGSGADEFIFRGNSGADVITDFKVGQDFLTFSTIAPFDESVGARVGLFGDDDVLSFITYADGNAVLDLSGLYSFANQALGFSVFSGADDISVTFLGVAEGSLTGDNFFTPQDVFPEDDILVVG